MTYEDKLNAIDRYFDNISSSEFNRICEEKYGIPSNVTADNVSACSSVQQSACFGNMRSKERSLLR